MFVMMALLPYAIYVGDWKIVGILMAGVMFVFGGDLGSWVRAWRGIPPPAAPEPPIPPVPPAGLLDKPEGP